MPSTAPLYTVAEVRAMPDDGNRYEVIAGQLFVTPAPAVGHQRVLGRLHLLLGNYVTRYALGELLFAPLDVVLGPRTLVQPDLLFIRRERAQVITERELTGLPDLVVEVISRSSARADRGRKLELYQDDQNTEYWIVDWEREDIEVWRAGARTGDSHAAELTWRPAADVEPLVIDLQELFRR